MHWTEDKCVQYMFLNIKLYIQYINMIHYYMILIDFIYVMCVFLPATQPLIIHVFVGLCRIGLGHLKIWWSNIHDIKQCLCMFMQLWMHWLPHPDAALPSLLSNLQGSCWVAGGFLIQLELLPGNKIAKKSRNKIKGSSDTTCIHFFFNVFKSI